MAILPLRGLDWRLEAMQEERVIARAAVLAARSNPLQQGTYSVKQVLFVRGLLRASEGRIESRIRLLCSQ